MEQKRRFSSKEDAEIWRFAMENHTSDDSRVMWNNFKKKTKSDRSSASLQKRITVDSENLENLGDETRTLNATRSIQQSDSRFRGSLLPRLASTKLHTETKLKICKAFNVQVNGYFLKKLKKDAVVHMRKNGTVKSYQLRASVVPNEDTKMNMVDFRRATSLKDDQKNNVEEESGGRGARFTSEEDRDLWQFVVQCLRDKDRTPSIPWKEFTRVNRSFASFRKRFIYRLAPTLHEADFDIETKLELYQFIGVPVNDNYLRTLRQHAELQIDRKNRIVSYRLTSEQRQRKRRNSSGGPLERKRGRVASDDEDDNDDDHPDDQEGQEDREVSNAEDADDLIIDTVVEGTGIVDPNRPSQIKLEPLYEQEMLNYEQGMPDYDYYQHPQFGPEELLNSIRQAVGEIVQASKQSMVDEVKSANRELISQVATVSNDSKNILLGKSTAYGVSEQSQNSRQSVVNNYLTSLKAMTAILDTPFRNAMEDRVEHVIQNLSDPLKFRQIMPHDPTLALKYYTLEENMQIWRFVIKNSDEKCGLHLWATFKEEVDSSRTVKALNTHFRSTVLAKLKYTQLHVETKLKLYQNNKYCITSSDLNNLEQHACVKLNSAGFIKRFRLKQSAGENNDANLDDDQLLMVIQMNKGRGAAFTPQEDSQLLKFMASASSEMFKSESKLFEGCKNHMKSDRSAQSFRDRFKRKLIHNLPIVDVDIGTKLKLYKSHQVPVDRGYLRTLKAHADLEINEQNVLLSYRFKDATEEDDAVSIISISSDEDNVIMDDYDASFNDTRDVDITGGHEDLNTEQDDTNDSDDDIVEFDAPNTIPPPVFPAMVKQEYQNDWQDYEQAGAAQQFPQFPMGNFFESLKEVISASNKSLVGEMTNAVTESFDNLKKEHSSLFKDIANDFQNIVSANTSVIENVIGSIKQEPNNPTSVPLDQTRVHYQNYLLSMKTLASSLDLQSGEDIHRRIDSALEKLSESSDPIDKTSLRMVMEVCSKLIN